MQNCVNHVSKRVLRDIFEFVGASEGTLWLLDNERQTLVPIWNSGPRAQELVGRHIQPLNAGLISLVCVSEQAICENGVYRNAGQDGTVDRKLGVLTCSMIAAPVRVRGAIVGVVSCVRLKPAEGDHPDPPPFGMEDLERVLAAVREWQTELEEA